MKKTIWAIALVSVLLSCVAGYRRAVNGKFIKAYEQSQYLLDEEKKLLSLNLEQGYVPYYNMGNAMYRQGSYLQAKTYYERALEQYPWHPDECRIRVNMALAMIAMIDFEGSHDDIVASLLEARAVLTEENCAHDKDDGGHSKEAEQLKKEIDEMLSQMGVDSQQQQQQEQEEQQEEQQDSDGDGMSEREQRIKERLEDRMQDNMRERSQTQDSYDQMGDGSDGWNYGGKTW